MCMVEALFAAFLTGLRRMKLRLLLAGSLAAFATAVPVPAAVAQAQGTPTASADEAAVIAVAQKMFDGMR